MAVVKYNVKGVDSSARNYEQPTPGVYHVKIHQATDRRPEKDDVEVVLEVLGGKFKGSRLWTYVGLGQASAWKFRQLQVDALGGKEAAQIDPEKVWPGQELKIRVNADDYDGQYKARVGAFLPLSAEGGQAATDDDDVDYDSMSAEELREACEEAGLSTKGSRAALIKRLVEAESATEDEDEGGEDEDEDGDGYSAEDFDEMDMGELEEAAEELDVDPETVYKAAKAKTTAKKVAALRAALVAALETDEEEGEGEGDEEEVDLDELDLDALVELAEENDLDPDDAYKAPKVRPKTKAQKEKALRVYLAEQLGGDEEDEEEEEEAPNYDEWELAALRKECKDRGLPTAGPKSKLVARLQKDDESGDDPFES